MQRYFVSPDQMTDSTVTIRGDDVKHIAKVMRMTTGDEVICSNNHDRVAKCEIIDFDDSRVELSVIEWLDRHTELPIPVTIAQGLPKSDKLEMIVQKGTELGANVFLPFQASRSIVKWDAKKSKKKTERLQKIIKEAAEQSHRNRMPVCEEPITFNELISQSNTYTIKVVAYEEDAKQSESAKLAELFQQIDPNKDRLLVVVGPEGGLTPEEVDELKKAGFVTCGLGPRILRTETAPLYVLAAVSYQLELLR
ncbi:16S rRNA (uracil(1498)-N(3))-methyltransferase [Pseudalkalibacillus berkeleyi]|uniref:Ribosomal RNA small subunit methyltransferase E n=1 Tax=Pseudalkalibacillus berkeleyi TaxID=1069813 RepID=A0ABS9H2A9_9BACL|nr:16S rRNA (uracil(1498)-N(3))-methyltransferase [Pseudalkalibacillus berkeleyi]MCF6137977.1 16S rRNA (uracil(1498)-N(3))-methyltransferase [Pseudalkalibacillus berkeleyi]